MFDFVRFVAKAFTRSGETRPPNVSAMPPAAFSPPVPASASCVRLCVVSTIALLIGRLRESNDA
jgi:hypothetical protein